MAKRENYNDLYLFMLVVREGSLPPRRSGRLAQSGVSRAVRELEERLGYSFWCVPPVNSRSPRPASSSIEPLNPALMR